MFSVPYEIAVVRPLRQTTGRERASGAARKAHYNTELIPQELIYIDLATDSGVSAISTNQFAALIGATAVEPGMGMAAEGSRALWLAVRSRFSNISVFTYIVPTTQGRSAERIWTKINVKPGSVVAGNMLFPSTRNHIEMNGAKIVDVIGDAAHDFVPTDSRSKAISISRNSKAVIQEQGAGQDQLHLRRAKRQRLRRPPGVAGQSQSGQSDRRGQSRFHCFSTPAASLRTVISSKSGKPAISSGQHRRDIVRETCALADGVDA